MTVNEQITKLLAEWHEAGRAEFETKYPSLDYDSTQRKMAQYRSKYCVLDNGGSGAFVLDLLTLDIYRIKAYGVPNRRKCVGKLGLVSGDDLYRLRWW